MPWPCLAGPAMGRQHASAVMAEQWWLCSVAEVMAVPRGRGDGCAGWQW
jgi:hypothetical protein